LFDRFKRFDSLSSSLVVLRHTFGAIRSVLCESAEATPELITAELQANPWKTVVAALAVDSSMEAFAGGVERVLKACDDHTLAVLVAQPSMDAVAALCKKRRACQNVRSVAVWTKEQESELKTLIAETQHAHCLFYLRAGGALGSNSSSSSNDDDADTAPPETVPEEAH
jgi:hypothetical protein